MKGIVLLINEHPPNNRTHVVFKYNPLDNKQSHHLMPMSRPQFKHSAPDPNAMLKQIYMKFPELNPEDL